jgi:hypothetical protein
MEKPKMSKVRKDGSGVLFQSEKKTEKHPDYTGSIILDQDYGKGSEIKIAGWRKPTPKGHLISISINTFKANADNQWPKRVDNDDDVPF